MEITHQHIERIEKMTFASVYPHYVTKIEKKGRTKEELHQVIEWLTGFDNRKIQELIDEKATFRFFFFFSKLNPSSARMMRGQSALTSCASFLVMVGASLQLVPTLFPRHVRYLQIPNPFSRIFNP